MSSDAGVLPAEIHDPAPRLTALLETRRWLILLVITVAWALATTVGLLQFGRLPTADRVLLLASAACAATGWSLSRRKVGLWILLGAPACLVAATAVGGAPGVAWIALPVSASHVAYGLVLLTSRRVGLVAIAAVVVGFIVIWQREPANVVAGALSIGGGWIAVVTLLLSALAIWWAWHALLRQAHAADAAYASLTARTVRELETQERSTALRAAAVRVHETLLSTIRYVLQAPALDRSGLATYTRSRSAPVPQGAEQDLHREVQSATAARIASDIVRVEPSAFDLPITEPTRVAVRAAIVECALNAVLHGGATEVVVSGRSEPGRVVLEIADDGRGVDPEATPGLGWSAVLTEGLGACGGTWSIERRGNRTVVSLSLPRAGVRSVFGREEDDGFDQGRILITAPLAMTALVGIAFDLLLARGSTAGWLLVAVVLGAMALGVTAVIRRRRVSLAFSVVTVVALGLIPWAIALTGPDADQTVLVASAVNAAGYAVITVAVWSRWWVWLIGLGTWASGVAALVSGTPQIQPLPVVVALINCLVAVPIVVSVSFVGARRLAQVNAALERQRETSRREALRASAALLIDQHLSSCVRQTESIIDRLSEGAALDDDTRNELASLEGLIRVTIQVDPVSGGGFARAASQLVTASFNRSQAVQVGTIIASEDQRPLPRATLLALDRVVAGAATAALRVFTDGSHDYLALELDETTLSADEVAAVEASGVDGVEVGIEDGADGVRVVMVSREIHGHALPK